jgi:hypothetical protein
MTIQMYLNKKYKASIVKPSPESIKDSEDCIDLDVNGVGIRCQFVMPAKPWKEQGTVLYHVLTEKQIRDKIRIERLRQLDGYGSF